MLITYFSGLTDSAKEGQWVWSSDNSRLEYSHWDTSDPNGGTYENCATVAGGKFNGPRTNGPGKWWSLNCDQNPSPWATSLKAICQKE